MDRLLAVVPQVGSADLYRQDRPVCFDVTSDSDAGRPGGEPPGVWDVYDDLGVPGAA